MSPPVRRFEDLLVWQHARSLSVTIARFSAQSLRTEPDLADQMKRAARSVCANIAEGFERNGRREFDQFLGIARASCGEVRSFLYDALDEGHLTESTFDTLKAQAELVSRMLYALQRSVRQQRGRKSPAGAPT
ncbi:MAG TPA: four helix bundle protein [Gemmatimonadales bacterium]|nr:four helix bundle protein [Gemmatimonadales bacterium]